MWSVLSGRRDINWHLFSEAPHKTKEALMKDKPSAGKKPQLRRCESVTDFRNIPFVTQFGVEVTHRTDMSLEEAKILLKKRNSARSPITRRKTKKKIAYIVRDAATMPRTRDTQRKLDGIVAQMARDKLLDRDDQIFKDLCDEELYIEEIHRYVGRIYKLYGAEDAAEFSIEAPREVWTIDNLQKLAKRDYAVDICHKLIEYEEDLKSVYCVNSLSVRLVSALIRETKSFTISITTGKTVVATAKTVLLSSLKHMLSLDESIISLIHEIAMAMSGHVRNAAHKVVSAVTFIYYVPEILQITDMDVCKLVKNFFTDKSRSSPAVMALQNDPKISKAKKELMRKIQILK